MDDPNTRSTKRRRLDNDDSKESYPIENLNQLRRLLQPTRNLTPDVKGAVNRFKDFLVAISRTEDVSVKSTKLQILRSYCNDQSATSKDERNFPDLFALWALAAEANNDSICSAVPAAFAQFYKTISGVLEFRDFGLSLGHTLLKRDQLRLFDRGLSAPRTKEHLISPCLRLLTEVVSFDVGVLANRAFDQRDLLLRRLDSLLDHQHVVPQEDRRRPTVRRMALRLVIANLKFLDARYKTEFIAHGRILRNCLNGMTSDGDDIVVDALKALELGLVEDKEVTRANKSRIFDRNVLDLLKALYDYESDHNHPDSATSVRDAIHAFLLTICASSRGILLSQTGWYPLGIEERTGNNFDNGTIDLGLDYTLHFDGYTAHYPVKNAVLSTFINHLKPESDTLQSALMLQIFKSAPELIADYFHDKAKLSISTSNDSSWRGSFAFVFSVAQLPIPRNFGWYDSDVPGPPPTTIVIESIVPKPMDRSTFAKFFSSDEDIMVLSGARLLTVALEKLQSILHSFSEYAATDLWQQASTGLIETFLRRVPQLAEIARSVESSGKKDESLRVALFECLATYHRVLPEAATDSKFDIRPMLLHVISQFETADIASDARKILDDQIQHLVTVAQFSSSMKWWYKPNPETLSLFTRLLQFLTAYPELSNRRQIADTMQAAIEPTGILSSIRDSFHALQTSLKGSESFEVSKETWLVIDNAIYRSIQRPVKYLDRIETVQALVSDKKPLSLVVAAVVEQWEFALKKYDHNRDLLENIAEWMIRYHGALESAGENFRVMQQFRDDMLQVADAQSRPILERAEEENRRNPAFFQRLSEKTEDIVHSSKVDKKHRVLNLDEIFGGLTIDSGLVEVVDRWDPNTDIETAMESGKIAKLLLGMSSPEDEVRRQTLESLQALAYAIEQSNYEEKTQLHLLVGEVIQTLKSHGLDKPLVSTAPELAVRLSRILADPVHKLYGKTNIFLLRSPSWDMTRLPSTWIKNILFREPDNDDSNAWSDEAGWLIQWLTNGLKTSQDMDLYRRSGIFEKIMTVYSVPNLTRPVRKMILGLVWRAIRIDGGADILITRFGILGWLKIVEESDREHRNIARQLRVELNKACDEEMVVRWKSDRPLMRRDST